MSNTIEFNSRTYYKAWQLLQAKKIIARENKAIKPISIYAYNRLTSTNIKLWSLIDSGVGCPIGAIALQQNAGKGQWGHSWISQPGGLYLSVGLNIDLDVEHHPHLVIATAWGIATVLRHYHVPVTIKWLNDLILDLYKLGGIKIETRNDKNQLTKAVVGVGINWRNDVPKPGINLESYDRDKDIKQIYSLEELTAIATYGILLGYEYYLAVGIEKLLTKYLEICNSIGKQIEFNGCPGEVVGVTTEGKLKVKMRSRGASTVVELAPGQISLGYE